MPANWYILQKVSPSGYFEPSLPVGVSDFAGTDEIGRECFIVNSPQSVVVPEIGIDHTANDFSGLTNAQVHALLPVRFQSGVNFGQIVSFLVQAGFSPKAVNELAQIKVGGE